MRLRFLVPLLGLSSLSLLAVACGDDDDDLAAGGGGAGGASPAETGGGGAGGACSTTGSGTVVVQVTGLPDGVMPDISIAGPDMLDATDVGPLEHVAAGDYVITVNRVYDADPIVRTAFDGKVTVPAFCLADGGSQTIKVAYTAIPSSNKLWMPTALDAELAGFSSELLSGSGTTDADVSIDGPGSKSVAFDKDGNLWALGPTVGDKMVARFPAARLGESGTVAPDISFDVPEVECVPSLSNIAFDPDGNLWLSACGGEVHRIPAADLTTSGDKTSDVVLTGLIDKDGNGNNEGLAFDAAGNLWVAGAGAPLRRYDAARLDVATSDPADLELSVKDDLAALHASYLAFDKDGNLWGADFAANALFEVPKAKLAQTGTKDQVATVSITVGVAALLSQPAFDDGGGLWLGLDTVTDNGAGGAGGAGGTSSGGGRIGRFSPAQLRVSAPAGDPATPERLLKSSSIDSELPIAFFPAAAGLPLYHAQP